MIHKTCKDVSYTFTALSGSAVAQISNFNVTVSFKDLAESLSFRTVTLEFMGD